MIDSFVETHTCLIEDLKKEFDTWLNDNDDDWSLNSPEENKIDSVELTNKELKHRSPQVF